MQKDYCCKEAGIMTHKKEGLSTVGLIFITFLSAFQYFFLQHVPASVSPFAFIGFTNLIGLVLLGAVQLKKLVTIRKSTILKGILLALELTGFNYFLMLGSRSMDAVLVSSILSLSFLAFLPILLILHKKVNFLSGIAAVIAIIALLLLFGLDTDWVFSSADVVYMLLADVFFAAYIVSVAFLGAREDSVQLTLSQIIFSLLFSLGGWLIESAANGWNISFHSGKNFWISAVLMGIFIRVICGLLQITCQKHVPALKTSLILSSVIVVTLLINPFMSRLMNLPYIPATIFQIFGGILLIIAALMTDDTVMAKLGYSDLRKTPASDAGGETVKRSSVSKKLILTTLTFTMVTLGLSTVAFLSAVFLIRKDAVSYSKALGDKASEISSDAILDKVEDNLQDYVNAKGLLLEQKLADFTDAVNYASSFAHSLYENPGKYPDKEVLPAGSADAGGWVMQRVLANDSISYESVRDESRLMGNMADVFAPIIRNNDIIASIHVATEKGLMLRYVPDSGNASADSESYCEFRELDWYSNVKDLGETVFTEPYQDTFGRGLVLTCAAPFFDTAGKYAGCVSLDILMSKLSASMRNDGIVNQGSATLIDYEGYYIAGKGVNQSDVILGSISDEGRDERLREAGDEILKKREGITFVVSEGSGYYIAFSDISFVNWILCIQLRASDVVEPVFSIMDSIEENTESVVSSVSRGISNVIQIGLLLSAVILLLVTMLTGRYSRRISDPIKRLEADVKNISAGNLDSRTEVSTDDEIGSLADSFNMMTDSLQKYIADLKEATAREQRIAGELSAATTIQASMLPRDFEAFSEGRPFELYATMHPAKEVGGDFYDYFMIDENRLGLVMADVSGKGVPAALFMVIAKTLIKNRAQMGGGPAEILGYVNDQLCENNEGELFVTVWFAILDLSTGKGMAANAGHEHPAVLRKGGEFELSVYRHSPAVAAMEGIPFREHEFEMNPGDRLFVYTDGVAEATDAKNEMYGTDRMLTALNRAPEALPEELLDNVRKDMDGFVKDAPQFDDITMLCFVYRAGLCERETRNNP